MIAIRPARITDAAAIGAVHVAGFRSAYPGILPDHYLQNLSARRLGMMYAQSIAQGGIVHVIARPDPAPRVLGFVTAGPARSQDLAQGEVQTLYVLDDFRDQGLGRHLLCAAARSLRLAGLNSLFVWVLRDNPARFFYAHLGGAARREGLTHVAGTAVPQIAYVWDPISKLADLQLPPIFS